jgi:hypothetical protein
VIFLLISGKSLISEKTVLNVLLRNAFRNTYIMFNLRMISLSVENTMYAEQVGIEINAVFVFGMYLVLMSPDTLHYLDPELIKNGCRMWNMLLTVLRVVMVFLFLWENVRIVLTISKNWRGKFEHRVCFMCI